jgi:hypothetical protein
MLKVISLGAGVQSTVMALMAAYGELGELPDYAVFADTQSEPEDVYTHLDWLEGEIKRLTNDRMRCVRVTAGNLEADVLEILQLEEIKGRHPTPPFFTPGRDGLAAPIRRQCTESYKIDPIRQWMRGQIDHPKGKVWKGPPEIECWIGISTDEIQRMRDARDRFVKRMRRDVWGMKKPIEATWPASKTEMWPLERIIPYDRNPRQHSPEQST